MNYLENKDLDYIIKNQLNSLYEMTGFAFPSKNIFITSDMLFQGRYDTDKKIIETNAKYIFYANATPIEKLLKIKFNISHEFFHFIQDFVIKNNITSENVKDLSIFKMNKYLFHYFHKPTTISKHDFEKFKSFAEKEKSFSENIRNELRFDNDAYVSSIIDKQLYDKNFLEITSNIFATTVIHNMYKDNLDTDTAKALRKVLRPFYNTFTTDKLLKNKTDIQNQIFITGCNFKSNDFDINKYNSFITNQSANTKEFIYSCCNTITDEELYKINKLNILLNKNICKTDKIFIPVHFSIDYSIDSISKTKIPFEHKQPLLGDDEESPLVAYCNKIRQDKNICNTVYDINDETIYFTKNSYDTKSNEDLEI